MITRSPKSEHPNYECSPQPPPIGDKTSVPAQDGSRSEVSRQECKRTPNRGLKFGLQFVASRSRSKSKGVAADKKGKIPLLVGGREEPGLLRRFIGVFGF